MMNGFLASRNIHAGESRVGRVLKELHAPYHVARQQVLISSLLLLIKAIAMSYIQR